MSTESTISMENLNAKLESSNQIETTVKHRLSRVIIPAYIFFYSSSLSDCL